MPYTQDMQASIDKVVGSRTRRLHERFPSFKAFSEASIDDVLGDLRPRASVLEVRTLASMVFLNRGDHFEAAPLPDEAQWSPAFGMSVADFDGDGSEDVFLSQNFFAMRLEEPRLDSGRGLCLRGLGQGAFRALPGQESGIKVYGGPLANNGISTKVYHRKRIYRDINAVGNRSALIGSRYGINTGTYNRIGLICAAVLP